MPESDSLCVAPRSLRVAEIFLFVVVGTWLIFAASVVDIEYYDGYDAICNARYFLGHTNEYLEFRGPLMSVLLLPAEWIKTTCEMNPLEVRPHHFTMVVIHLVYLVSVYICIAKRAGRGWPVLIAFLATMTTSFFFQFAHFISHDILAGAMVLMMLILADRFCETRRWWMLGALAALGAALPLIKHLNALIWILIVGVYCVFAMLPRRRAERVSIGTAGMLFGAAVVSGIIVIIVFGIVLQPSYPSRPLVMRPFDHVRFRLSAMKDIGSSSPWWVYIRNFPVFGLVTTILIVPGIVMGFCGDRFRKSVSAVWVLAFLVIHFVSLREVRYIAFLAPLSAVLVVPLFAWLLKRRIVMVAVAVLFAADVCLIVSESARVPSEFYTRSEVKEFLEPVWSPSTRPAQVLINTTIMSFPSPRHTSLAGDRHDKIFHFGTDHLRGLFGYGVKDIVGIRSPGFYDASATTDEGAVFLYSNDVIYNAGEWSGGPPPGLDRFVQVIAVADTLPMRRRDEKSFLSADGDVVVVRMLAHEGRQIVIVGGESLVAKLHGSMFPVAVLDLPRRQFPLVPLGAQSGYFELRGMRSLRELSDEEEFEIRRFAVQRSNR